MVRTNNDNLFIIDTCTVELRLSERLSPGDKQD